MKKSSNPKRGHSEAFTLKLLTSDGKIVDLQRDFCEKHFKTISNVLDDTNLEDLDNPIPIPGVTADELQKIIILLNHCSSLWIENDDYGYRESRDWKQKFTKSFKAFASVARENFNCEVPQSLYPDINNETQNYKHLNHWEIADILEGLDPEQQWVRDHILLPLQKPIEYLDVQQLHEVFVNLVSHDFMALGPDNIRKAYHLPDDVSFADKIKAKQMMNTR